MERSLDRLRKKAKGRIHPVKASAEQRKTKFVLTISIKERGARMREGMAAKKKTDSSG